MVHRYVYEIHHGALAKGLGVRTTCGVKRCVRPDHLETYQRLRDREREVVKDGKFLGRLCTRGHGSAEDADRSWRYTCGTCCVCTVLRASTPEARVKAAEWAKQEEVRQRKNLRQRTPEARQRKRELRNNDEHRAKAAAYMSTPAQKQKKREWLERNRERMRQLRNERRRKKIAEDENYRIESNLRRRLCKAMAMFTTTGKTLRTKEYGIDYAAIIAYLGPCPGPREAYAIDHIRPLCSFDLTDPEQVRQAFSPENHRWLTTEENQRKATRERRRYYASRSSN